MEVLEDYHSHGHCAFSVPSKSKRTLQNHVSKPSLIQMVARATCGIKLVYNLSKIQSSPSTEIGGHTDKDGQFIVRNGFVLGRRFKIVSQVQASGQSAVLVNAQDLYRDKMEVVIKILHLSYFAVGLKEIQTLRRLNSSVSSCHGSHVISLLSAFRFDNHICLVIPAYSPSPLTQIFKRKELSSQQKLSQIRKIAFRLLSALAFLNQQQTIHADLKPENILMDKDEAIDSIVVTDFGNAILHVHKEIILYYSDFELQTLPYRAPEIFIGMPFSVEIDMWSLGCILAELFISRPLFSGENHVAVLKKVIALLGPLPSHMWLQGKFSEEMQMMMAPEEDSLCTSHSSVQRLMSKLPALTEYNFASFLSSLLALDPNRRLTPLQALQHPFIAREFCINYFFPDSMPHTGVSSSADYKIKQEISLNVKRMCPSTYDILRVGTSDAHLRTYVKQLEQGENEQLINKPTPFDQVSCDQCTFQSRETCESERLFSTNVFNEKSESRNSSSSETSMEQWNSELSFRSENVLNVLKNQSNNTQICRQVSDSIQQQQQDVSGRKCEPDAFVKIECATADEPSKVINRMPVDTDRCIGVSPCVTACGSNGALDSCSVIAGEMSPEKLMIHSKGQSEDVNVLLEPSLPLNKRDDGSHETGSEGMKSYFVGTNDDHVNENSFAKVSSYLSVGCKFNENEEDVTKTELEMNDGALGNINHGVKKDDKENEMNVDIANKNIRNIQLISRCKLKPQKGIGKKEVTNILGLMFRPTKRKCSLNATYGEKVRHMYSNVQSGGDYQDPCSVSSLNAVSANMSIKRRGRKPKANASGVKISDDQSGGDNQDPCKRTGKIKTKQGNDSVSSLNEVPANMTIKRRGRKPKANASGVKISDDQSGGDNQDPCKRTGKIKTKQGNDSVSSLNEVPANMTIKRRGRKPKANASGVKISDDQCGGDNNQDPCKRTGKIKTKQGNDSVSSLNEVPANMTIKRRGRKPKANASGVKISGDKNQRTLAKNCRKKSQRIPAHSNKTRLSKSEVSYLHSSKTTHNKKGNVSRKTMKRTKCKTDPIKEPADVSEPHVQQKELDLRVNIKVALEQENIYSHRLEICSGYDEMTNRQPDCNNFPSQNNDRRSEQFIVNLPTECEGNISNRSSHLKDVPHKVRVKARRALWKSSGQSSKLEKGRDVKQPLNIITQDQVLHDNNALPKGRKRLLKLSPSINERSRSDPYEFKVTPQKEERSPNRKKRNLKEKNPSHSQCKRRVKISQFKSNNSSDVDVFNIHSLVQRKSEQFFGVKSSQCKGSEDSNLCEHYTSPNPEETSLSSKTTTDNVCDTVPITGNVCNTVTSNVSNTVISNVCNVFTSNVCNAVTSNTVSGNACNTVIGNACNAVTGSVYNTVTSNVCNTITSNVYNTVISNVCNSVTSNACNAVMNNTVSGNACSIVIGNASGSVYNTVTRNACNTLTDNVYNTVTGNACNTLTGNVYNTVIGNACNAVTGSVYNTVTRNACNTLTGHVYKTVSENACNTLTGNVYNTITSNACNTVTGSTLPSEEMNIGGLSEGLSSPEKLIISEPSLSPTAESDKKEIIVGLPISDDNMNSTSNDEMKISNKSGEVTEMRKVHADLEITSDQKALISFDQSLGDDMSCDDDILLL